MQYRRVFFDFQTGDGFEEVTNLVKFDDLTYTVRAGSDNFHYAQNTANISLIYDATIYGKVRDNTADIIVRIIDTDETAAAPVVYTPRFWGHIAPTKSHNYNGIINVTILKLEAIDDGDYLKKEVGDVCYRGFRIMDPANPDYSIVHQLAYRAGFTVAQIDSAVSIPTVLNAFVPPSTSDDIRDLLDALLFEYGYTLAFNAEGEISPIKWMYTAAALSFTFNETNIIDKLDVNDRLKEYDGAEVTYYELGEGTTTSGQTDILLYRDGDLPYADDGTFLGYAVLSGYTYPPLTNILDETTGEATVVYQEYEDTSIKYWTNKAITDKLDYNYKAFTSDFSSIIATSGHYLDYKADAGVSLVTSEFQNTQARIVFSGMNNTANLLYYCNVYGKVLYKTAERISTVVTISGSEDLDEYVSTFIFEKDDADTLVKFLALQHSTNNLEIEVISSADVAVGAMVQVVANDGTNELCRIATKKYNEKTLQFTYTLYSYMYGSGATLPDLTSQKASSPSRIGGVTSSVAVADLRAALGGELYVSTTGITRSRNGALLPDEIIADAKYKYDATAYSGRFTVEVSGDGQTYHEHYKSITDEASHTFEVPVRSNVPDCQAYFPADDVSPYPDDPAGTLQILKDIASISGYSGAGCALSVEGDRLKVTITESAWYFFTPAIASFAAGKTLRAGYTAPAGRIIRLYEAGTTGFKIKEDTTDGLDQIIDGTSTTPNTRMMINCAGWTIGDVVYFRFFYIGTGKYLDGSLQNQISDSYDATIYGCVPDGAGGLIGDGVNDVVKTLSLVPIYENMARAIVYKPASLPASSAIFFAHGNYRVNGEYFWIKSDGAIQVTRNWSGVDSVKTFSGFAYTAGVEHKLMFNSRGIYLDLYVDGIFISTLTFTQAQATGSQYLSFFNFISGSYFANGTISGVRTFPRSLTALEVQQLYNDPTDPPYYTVDVRTRLYASGGFTTRIGEAHTTVAADPSTAAEYLGIGILTGLDREAYTSATVDEDGTITVIGAVNDVFAGDTVVNYSSSGGVTTLGMHIWSGTAWVKTTNIKKLSPAMTDLFGLNAAGIELDDVTTVVILIAKQILAENVDVTGQLTVQAGGRMRYETGAGVQKRCVQLADEKIDWIDTPDTMPPSPEQLRFRLGRLGVGGSVIADGDLLTNLDQGFSTPLQSSINLRYYPSLLARYNENTYCSYSDTTLGNLYFANVDRNTGALSGDAIVTSNGGQSSLFESSDGIMHCLYTRWETDGYICEKKYNDSTSAWGAETVVIGSSGVASARFIEIDGVTYIYYIISNNVYIRTWDGTSLGTAILLKSGVYDSSMCFGQDKYKALWLYYTKTADGDLYRSKLSASALTLSDEAIVASEGSSTLRASEPMSILLMDDREFILYVVPNIGVRYRYIEDSVVSDPTTLVAWTSIQFTYSPRAAQHADGNIIIALGIDPASTNERLFTMVGKRYARVGAGIVASGGNDLAFGGRWEKYGNGKLIQWGWGYFNWSAAGIEKSGDITFPISFKDKNIYIYPGKAGKKTGSNPTSIYDDDGVLDVFCWLSSRIIDENSFALSMYNYTSLGADGARRMFTWRAEGTYA